MHWFPCGLPFTTMHVYHSFFLCVCVTVCFSTLSLCMSCLSVRLHRSSQINVSSAPSQTMLQNNLSNGLQEPSLSQVHLMPEICASLVYRVCLWEKKNNLIPKSDCQSLCIQITIKGFLYIFFKYDVKA